MKAGSQEAGPSVQTILARRMVSSAPFEVPNRRAVKYTGVRASAAIF